MPTSFVRFFFIKIKTIFVDQMQMTSYRQERALLLAVKVPLCFFFHGMSIGFQFTNTKRLLKRIAVNRSEPEYSTYMI